MNSRVVEQQVVNKTHDFGAPSRAAAARAGGTAADPGFGVSGALVVT